MEVGILRLRGRAASLRSHFAQDDTPVLGRDVAKRDGGGVSCAGRGESAFGLFVTIFFISPLENL
jgi:hypothetical protein